MKIVIRTKGGSGSGNFNHAGITGHQGGSAPVGGGGSIQSEGGAENSGGKSGGDIVKAAEPELHFAFQQTVRAQAATKNKTALAELKRSERDLTNLRVAAKMGNHTSVIKLLKSVSPQTAKMAAVKNLAKALGVEASLPKD